MGDRRGPRAACHPTWVCSSVLPGAAATGPRRRFPRSFPRAVSPRFPALARRGGVAWCEEQSDEGARPAAARGARMPRQCQRFQMPRPKAAVVPGATVARAEGVPEDRKAPERARERR